MKLLGYPVDINDHIDDGTGADEIAVYFGNFRRGLILAEHRMLTIANEYRETRPGACTFFSAGPHGRARVGRRRRRRDGRGHLSLAARAT